MRLLIFKPFFLVGRHTNTHVSLFEQKKILSRTHLKCSFFLITHEVCLDPRPDSCGLYGAYDTYEPRILDHQRPGLPQQLHASDYGTYRDETVCDGCPGPNQRRCHWMSRVDYGCGYGFDHAVWKNHILLRHLRRGR